MYNFLSKKYVCFDDDDEINWKYQKKNCKKFVKKL